ncbi:uncharacterized protein LOC108680132 [Hyalella azteca]|uniref:Uncharacterized protein LOC108680132 n=1 Tax=Hyalella azteca TaxID=294128 RepID=A0A8B7PFM5_HYAAZ|nr:uncharacterized protein LOC108680132 [Hyalella azteca]XP_018024393.1 uncharacterized protein LOC108680132 [Hyalella azteca]
MFIRDGKELGFSDSALLKYVTDRVKREEERMRREEERLEKEERRRKEEADREKRLLAREEKKRQIFPKYHCLKTAMLLLLFALLLLSKEGEALIGYDCQAKNASFISVALADIKQCNEAIGSFVEEEISGQIIQIHQYQPVHVYSCLISVIITTEYCGKLNRISAEPKGITSHIKHLGPSACMDAHTIGTVNIHGQQFNGLKKNSTTTIDTVLSGSVDDGGYCKNGGIFIHEDGTKSEDKLVRATMKISLYDRTETLSLEADKVIVRSLGLECPADNGYCADTLVGEVVWKELDGDCTSRVDVLYEGPLSLVTFAQSAIDAIKIIIVYTRNQMFALRVSGFGLKCGHPTMTTEHKRIHVVKKSDVGIYVFSRSPKFNNNVDLKSYIDSQFLYASTAFIKGTDQIVRDFSNAMCQNKREILKKRLVLSQLRPDQVGTLVERKLGVTASIQGEVMFIITCVPVPVVYRKGAGCTQEIPVMYNGKPMFVEPITRILTTTGTSSICSSKMAPKFRIDEKWMTVYNGPMESAAPKILDPNSVIQSWKFIPLLDISKNGLYDAEDIESLQKSMMFGDNREALTTNFAKVLYDNGKTGNEGFSAIVTEDDISGLGSRIGGWMFRVTDLIGQTTCVLLGIFVIIELFLYLVDCCLNGTIIYKKMGWSLWILAAPLHAIVHMITHDITRRRTPAEDEDQPEEVRVEQKN